MGVVLPGTAVVFHVDAQVVARVDFGADGERAARFPGVAAVQDGVRDKF
jgi:hypothetical protein